MSTTAPVTVAERFAANAFKGDLRNMGLAQTAMVVDHAQHVEAFPHSYTEAAQAVSLEVMHAAARRDLEGVQAHVERVQTLRLGGAWFTATTRSIA